STNSCPCPKSWRRTEPNRDLRAFLDFSNHHFLFCDGAPAKEAPARATAADVRLENRGSRSDERRHSRFNRKREGDDSYRESRGQCEDRDGEIRSDKCAQRGLNI